MDEKEDAEMEASQNFYGERPAKRRFFGRKRKMSGGYKGRFRRSIPRSITKLEHTFQDSFLLQQLTSASGQGIGYQFAVSNLTNFASYRALFDEYKFLNIKIIAHSVYTEAPVGVAGANYMPTVYIVVDPNDSTAPASRDEMLQTGRERIIQLSKPTVIANFTPTVLLDTGAATGKMEAKKTWISLENVATPFYGLKIWIEPILGATQSIDLVAKYTVSMRSSR